MSNKISIILFLTIASLISTIVLSTTYYQSKVSELERNLTLKSIEVDNLTYQFNMCKILYRGL